jgi:uncharacterized protein DUF2798
MSTLSTPAISTPVMPGTFRKLPATFNAVAMPLILSLFMSGMISAFSTLRSVGLAADLATQWLGAWGASWALAFPTALLIVPVARRIVAAVVEPVGASR